MIDWSTIKPGLLVLVKALTGLDQAEWFDKTRPHVAGPVQAIALLTVTAVRTIGQAPESKFAPVDPDHPEAKWFETTTSSKVITVQVRVESYAQEDDQTAEMYLDRMRDRLFQVSYVLAFRTLGLGVNTFSPFRSLAMVRDNRIRSIGACDLLLNLGSSDTDPTEYEIIESLDDPEMNPDE